jgi:hypothetical protein
MRIPVILILCSLIIWSTNISAEILVIMNKHSQVSNLTRRQLVDLYMGRAQALPNGEAALPLDQSPTSAIRKAFYQGLVGRSVAEMNAYWARLLFTGRASPPRVLDEADAILRAVRQNRGVIGYIDASELDGTVKVVARVE